MLADGLSEGAARHQFLGEDTRVNHGLRVLILTDLLYYDIFDLL